jgi:hypothetical protein
MPLKESQGQQKRHQIENSHDDLRKNRRNVPPSSETFKILTQVKKGPNYERRTQWWKEIAKGSPRVQAKSEILVAKHKGERKGRTDPKQIEGQY